MAPHSVWGKLGEYAATFKKGSHIMVEGELRTREYENNGVRVRTYDIVANSILILRPGQRASAQDTERSEAATVGTAPENVAAEPPAEKKARESARKATTEERP